MAQLNEYLMKNTLFIDIETAAQKEELFKDSSDVTYNELWSKKAANLKNEENKPNYELYEERAALFPEFGQIICIGVGFITKGADDTWIAKVKTSRGGDEKDTIQQFFELISKYPTGRFCLVAHNGKEFDFPYICKRAIVNGLELPETLRIAGKKPWEILHQDTLEMWRFGDFKSWTSLSLLCHTLGIPSPKESMDGSKVNEAYWNGLADQIAEYCKDDVIATMQCWLRINMFPIIEPQNIVRL